MKLTEVQQPAIQARMNLIVGATIYDRLFLGATYYALHLSIVASQITGALIEFGQVLPERLRQCD